MTKWQDGFDSKDRTLVEIAMLRHCFDMGLRHAVKRAIIVLIIVVIAASALAYGILSHQIRKESAQIRQEIGLQS